MIGIVKMFDGNYGGKFEVFNPYNQRVCEMPDLIGDEQIFGYSFFLFLNHKLFYNVKFKMPDSVDLRRYGDRGTMCGDLLCFRKKCARLVGGSFVKDAVTLVEDTGQLCWARHNGVRLLGGGFSAKGRFSSSSK